MSQPGCTIQIAQLWSLSVYLLFFFKLSLVLVSQPGPRELRQGSEASWRSSDPNRCSVAAGARGEETPGWEGPRHRSRAWGAAASARWR